MRLPEMTTQRWLVAVAGVVAITGLVMWGLISLQGSNYHLAAERCAEYAEGYANPRFPATYGEGGFGSCYGGRWDDYSNRVEADIRSHYGDWSYLREKADSYRGLSQKYARSSATPWRQIPVGPPPGQ
jgi:hypothetical protein